MTDVGGGRVYIEVVGDATGLHDDIAAKVAAASEGIQVKVGVDVDGAALRERVEAAARLAETGQQVRLRVEAAGDDLRAQLTEAAVEASAGEAAHIGVELETGAEERIRLHLEEVAARASAGVNAHVGVDVDRGAGGVAGAAVSDVAGAAGAAEQEAAAASSAATSTTGLGGSALLAAAALAVLTGGLGAATGAAGGLLGMIGPLAGLVAALPAVFAVAGAGLGTLFAGLHGIAGAVTALGKQQSGAGPAAMQYADAQIAAAERIQSAEQSLANARRSQRDAQITTQEQIHAATERLAAAEYAATQQRIQDVRSVIDAEYQLQQAERAEADAQRGLNEARQAAARQLQDLKNAATDAALSQQSAQLSLEQARNQLAQTNTNPNATALQRQQATLAVEQAQQRLNEATLDAKRATDDNTAAQQKGVNGSDQVISATERLVDAQHAVLAAVQAVTDAQAKQAHDAVISAQAVADSQQALRDTYRTTGEQIVSAAQAVANAQRSLADAERAQAQAARNVGGAATAANLAMQHLSPTAQAFARQIRAILDGPLKELEARAQAALIPGLSRALTIVAGPSGLWPQLNRLVTATGGAIGDVAVKLAELATSPATRHFIDILGPASARIIRAMGDGIAHWGAVFRDFAQAALPLITRLADGFDRVAGRLDATFSSRKGQQELGRFFDQVYTTTVAWYHILGNLGDVLFGIIKAAVPAGNSLNTSFENITRSWATWVNSDAGQAKLKDFFDKAVPVVEHMASAIAGLVSALIGISGDKQWASFFDAITKAAPGIGKFLAAFGPGVATAVADAAQALSALADAAGPLAPVLGPLALGLVGLWAAFKGAKAVNDAVDGVSKGLGTLRQILSSGASGIASKEAPAMARAVAAISRTLKLPDLGRGAGDAMKKLDDVVLTSLGNLATKASTAAKDIVAKVVERLKIGGGGDAGFLDLGGLVRNGGAAEKELATAAEGMAALEAGEAGAATGAGILGTALDIALGPVGLIIAAVGLLAVGFYEAYKHIGPFHDAVDAVGRALSGAFHAALSAVSTAIGWVTDHWKLLATIILPILGPIGLVVDALLNWRNVVNWLESAFSHFGGMLYNDAVGWFTSLWNGLKAVWHDLVGWVSGIPHAFITTIDGFGSSLYNIGLHVMQGLWNGLKDQWHEVTKWLSSLNPASWFNDINVEQGHADVNLLPMGRLVMGGLHKGLQQGWTQVASWLSTIDPSKQLTASVVQGLTVNASEVATAGRQLQAVAAGDGAAAGTTIHVEDGAIRIANPAPEPASTSIATRMRRLAVMHEPPPRVTPAPGAA